MTQGTIFCNFGSLQKYVSYVKIRTRFLVISLNNIYTSQADFQYNIERQDTTPCVTPFCHLVLLLKSIAGDQSNILCHASKITTHTIQIDLQYNSEYAGSCGQF